MFRLEDDQVARRTERKEQRRRDSGCNGPAAQAAGPIDDDGSAPDAEVQTRRLNVNAISRADWNLSVRFFSRQRWVTFASAGEISPMVPVKTGGSCLRIALSVSTTLSA